MNTQTITQLDYTAKELSIVPGPAWVLVDYNLSPRGKPRTHSAHKEYDFVRVLDSGDASIQAGRIAVVQKADGPLSIDSRFDPLLFVRVESIIALIDPDEPVKDEPTKPDIEAPAVPGGAVSVDERADDSRTAAHESGADDQPE